MRAKRFHGLKRIKIRQTWKKYNLYNLSRQRTLFLSPLTHYQQKWKSKSTARAYHGEQIREKQWQRLFSSKLRSVVPMDHRYLAAYNGSEQALGRGSGREISKEQQKRSRPLEPVPYMQMTFAPAERRLDTAVFRALFASSARQARQFVIRGAVKVNGEKMVYPGYMLNPGDMFQVDPDSVMFATGAQKDRKERLASRLRRRKAKHVSNPPEEEVDGVQEKPLNSDATSTPAAETSNDPQAAKETSEAEKRASVKVGLKGVLASAKAILYDKKVTPRAKQKKALRQLSAKVRTTVGSVNKKPVETLDEDLNSLLSELKITTAPPVPLTKGSNAAGKPGKDQKLPPQQRLPKGLISHEDRMALREAMREARENPVDASKPYATPWHPRPYMSAFAFIPRYLEVNQNICSAVYLRHPVARPGLSEVPTPFASETSQLAFTWYLRRR